MATPEIKFAGPEYDGAEAELGTFENTVVRIVEHVAGKKYGEKNVLTPTDILIMPVVIEDDRFFIIKAWHETAAAKGRAGVLQPIEGSFDVVADDTNAFLHHREEDGANYKLTTVETINLGNLGRLAATYDAISTQIASEPS